VERETIRAIFRACCGYRKSTQARSLMPERSRSSAPVLSSCLPVRDTSAREEGLRCPRPCRRLAGPGGLMSDLHTYAEATLTRQVPDWIASHQPAFAFLGGVTTALVYDQLKSGVVIPCRYEPGLQRTYEEFRSALRGGDSACEAGESARQGEGRSGRPGRGALDPRPPPPRGLLLARRAQRAHRRAARWCY